MPSSVVYDATLGGVTLKQVRSSAYSTNNVIATDYTSGGVDPDAHYLVQATPQVMFTSGDLDGVIDGFTSNERLAIASGTITVPYNLRANGGTFASGTAHDTLDGTDALFVIQSYTASQGEADGSSVSIAGYFISTDGETAPVSVSTSQTLSSAAYNATHKLGPVTVNGSAVSGITRVTVNTGITVENEFVEGDTYPTANYITRRAPTIDITGRYMSLFTTLGPIFTTQTACVVKFRKRAVGGTVVSGATSAHLSFTAADGIVSVDQVAASGNAAGEVTLRLHCEALTIASTATIS